MDTLRHSSAFHRGTVKFSRLLELERRGRYRSALELISDCWSDPDFLPDTSDLADEAAAELLLRFAALYGFCGHEQQIADAQTKSRDILTKVRERFAKLGDAEKQAQCDNYIALSYWRTGEANEAEIWIESALSAAADESEAKMYAHVTRSLVNLAQKKYHQNIFTSGELGPMFFRFGNAFLTGSYCTNLALSFKNIGRFDDALRYLELARDYHQISKHRVCLGTVENNLAALYAHLRRFTRAHSAADNAIKAFKFERDRTREGFALDTKARLFIAEGEFNLATDTAQAAVRILRRGENKAYLSEALQTFARARAFLGDLARALAAVSEAIDITLLAAGEKAAAAVFEEFQAAVSDHAGKTRRTLTATEANTAATDLKLVIPKSLAHFKDFRGVWINNCHLESLGLKRGSLAVVVPGKVARGDLAALTDVETKAVHCGFYDAEFGIVCLDGVKSDPRLFDAADIEMIGKIVGFSTNAHDDFGAMIIEPLADTDRLSKF